MQLLLQPRPKLSRQNRRRTFRADRDRHLAAIDDGRQRKRAQLRPVRHVHRHTKRARDRRDACIFRIILGRGNHQWPTRDGVAIRRAGNQQRLAISHQRMDAWNRRIRGDFDKRRAFQQQPRLDQRQLAAANHQRRHAADLDENRKARHRLNPQSMSGRSGCRAGFPAQGRRDPRSS